MARLTTGAAKGDRENVKSGLDDILGSVIRTDRRNSGRKSQEASLEEEPSLAPGTPDSPESPVTASDSGPGVVVMTSVSAIKQTNNNTLTQYDNNIELEPDQIDDHETLLDRRWEEAIAMAASPTTTVTLRVPHAFNDWLDEYLHGAWPEKIKKQELLIEALQLLYVRRGKPKEEILETELLPQSQTAQNVRGRR